MFNTNDEAGSCSNFRYAQRRARTRLGRARELLGEMKSTWTSPVTARVAWERLLEHPLIQRAGDRRPSRAQSPPPALRVLARPQTLGACLAPPSLPRTVRRLRSVSTTA